jgi:hypothetical protein
MLITSNPEITALDILHLAQRTHPGARYLTVFKFDPANWPAIYEHLRYSWPAYDEPATNCPSVLVGRGGIRVQQGEWAVYNRGPKRG